METMQQLKNAHRKAVAAGAKLSLMAFAVQEKVVHIIEDAHMQGRASRGEATRGRTRLANAAKKLKGKKTAPVAAK